MGLFDDLLDLVVDVADSTVGIIGDGVSYVVENPIKSLVIVGAGVATGGIAFAAAPVLATTAGGLGLLGAASTGTSIATLSGAALTNASLAAIGGGAIATGGGGMAAGVATISAVGAVTGTAATAVAVSNTDS